MLMSLAWGWLLAHQSSTCVFIFWLRTHCSPGWRRQKSPAWVQAARWKIWSNFSALQGSSAPSVSRSHSREDGATTPWPAAARAARRCRPRNPPPPVTKTRMDLYVLRVHRKVELDALRDQVLMPREDLLLEIPGEHVVHIGLGRQLVLDLDRDVAAGGYESAPVRVALREALDQ